MSAWRRLVRWVLRHFTRIPDAVEETGQSQWHVIFRCIWCNLPRDCDCLGRHCEHHGREVCIVP